jgi:hypothetical protein
MWKTQKEESFMEEKTFNIDCDLLAWIKDKSQKSRDCQIILTIENNKVIRATCYMTDSITLGK